MQEFYVGYTENLRKRLTEHKSGKIKTTKSFVTLENYLKNARMV